jgi:molybdopterin-containing oxidoreductase family membrane subunit
VACAGLFPVLHTGRPWLAYWLLPYPNSMWLWPQPRSPLLWDVFAVSTYATVSVLFWLTGLVPDFAVMRDKAVNRWQQVLFGILSLGWRGSAKHWERYQMAYLLLAGLSTPLVLSVHTVVSFDFAISILPGWHTTIFPPYFVAGAVYSGFAMVLTLAIPTRKWFHLEDIITLRHLESASKVMLGTGLIVAYGYSMEAFISWYSGNTYERFMYWNRMTGPYGFFYGMLILCNIAIPQLLWSQKVRRSIPALFIISLVVNMGMWLERFVIVVVSLHRDFLPSSWGMYYPTVWDWATFVGTLGLFTTLMWLFVRFVPMIAIFEVREVVHHLEHQKLEVSPSAGD